MAKDFEIIARIEQWLHVFVSRELSSTTGETWWTDGVPEDIRARCEERAKDEGDQEHPFRFTQLPDLQNVLLANWDTLRLGDLGKIWRSKTQVRSAFNCLIRSRNRTMHPTRGGADENDRVFLQRLYSALAGGVI